MTDKGKEKSGKRSNKENKENSSELIFSDGSRVQTNVNIHK